MLKYILQVIGNMNKLLNKLREGESFSLKDSLILTIQLSLPAILAQISTIIMEYVDASMVGRLGAKGSASIGLVASSTWLMSGLVNAMTVGFTVQIAQLIGAKKEKEARDMMKHGLITCLIFSFILCIIGIFISQPLPVLLGGNKSIIHYASSYFLIYSIGIPLLQLNNVSSGMIQASGDMKIPSFLNVIMCILNIFLNMIFIFPSHTFYVLPGFNLGVSGAALGTITSEGIIGLLMVYFLLFKNKILSLRHEKTSIHKDYILNAIKISIPVALEQVAQNGAQIVATRIVAPLGTISIAANSLSVTAESLCYMPGYGMSVAASTIIGQSIGAKREDLTKRLGIMITLLGMLVMSITGAMMYFLAPYMLSMLSPDPSIQRLGTEVLRIEAFVEPLFAASIVATGVFRGAGDTLIPSVFNFISMWGVRLPLAYFMSQSLGLKGVWIAMAIELSIRGLLFLIRLLRNNWLTK